MLQKSYTKLLEERQIPCRPLGEILNEYASGKQIDFLNIDVEGMGLEVLRTFDWQKGVPRVICIEDDELMVGQDTSPIRSFLSEHSYSLYAQIGPSCIYTR